jgi:3-hydroxybutyryl-CoA dehydrogenase
VREINKVAVVGAGYMGGGIAQCFALAGMQVQLADASAEATTAQLARLLNEAAQFEAQGLFPKGAADTIRANLHAAPSIEDAVRDAEFVEEAVFEKLDVKHDVLARICAATGPDTIIGTNTSTLPVKVLVTAVTNPARFLTVHFSNPAPFIPGVELVRGEATDPAIIPTVKEIIRRTGKRSAEVADRPGFVLNRLQYALFKEAASVVEEGIATPEDVDTIVSTTFGFRLPFFGPFGIADMAGLDVYAMGMNIVGDQLDPRLAAPKLLRETVAEGRHGTKNGKGFHGDFTPDQVAAIVAYRNRAYARMAQLLEELGPSPIEKPVK